MHSSRYIHVDLGRSRKQQCWLQRPHPINPVFRARTCGPSPAYSLPPGSFCGREGHGGFTDVGGGSGGGGVGVGLHHDERAGWIASTAFI